MGVVKVRARWVEGDRVKVLALRRDDACASCSVRLAAGATVAWFGDERVVRCLDCAGAAVLVRPLLPVLPVARDVPAGPVAAAPAPGSPGSPGRPAPGTAEAGGSVGSADAAGVWGRGVYGEEAVGATLDGLAGAGLLVLHERLMRDEQGRLTRARIDHVAVAAGGVWVVRAKASKGSLRVRRSPALLGPGFGDRGRRLLIGGRDHSELLVAVARQVAVVRGELAAAGRGVPVHGALCFVGTELPWFRRSVDDIRLLGRPDLAGLLTRPGPLSLAERQSLAEFLDERFPRR